MSPTSEPGGRGQRPPALLHDGIEFAIIAGLCLIAIYVVIPNQTSPSGEIGLSPDLLPTACAVAIALLALIQFVLKLVRGSAEPKAEPSALDVSLKLIAATVIGAVVVRVFGWELGGATLTMLTSLVLGERRPMRLALSATGAALFLFAVGWSGI